MANEKLKNSKNSKKQRAGRAARDSELTTAELTRREQRYREGFELARRAFNEIIAVLKAQAHDPQPEDAELLFCAQEGLKHIDEWFSGNPPFAYQELEGTL